MLLRLRFISLNLLKISFVRATVCLLPFRKPSDFARSNVRISLASEYRADLILENRRIAFHSMDNFVIVYPIEE